VRVKRGSKCDGEAVTFTAIDVPAAYANSVGICGWQRGRGARERMARKREKKSGSKCGGETATFTAIEAPAALALASAAGRERKK